RTVSGVRKAVKWNSPLYGVEGQGWFLGIHTFTNYVKVVFFRGTSLRPVPPGESKSKDTRYLDIHEDDQLDEAQLAAWVKQASRLPGAPISGQTSEVRAWRERTPSHRPASPRCRGKGTAGMRRNAQGPRVTAPCRPGLTSCANAKLSTLAAPMSS